MSLINNKSGGTEKCSFVMSMIIALAVFLLLSLVIAPAGAVDVGNLSDLNSNISDNTITVINITADIPIDADDSITPITRPLTITSENHKIYRTGANTSRGCGMFTVLENGNLTLSGNVVIDGSEISGNTQTLIWVDHGGNLTIKDNVVLKDNAALDCGGAVSVKNSSSFYMAGGTISGNLAPAAGGVYINDNGVFIMYNGEISGNNASNNGGGGVYNNNSTFIMSGGNISCNEAVLSGGGVFIERGGEFAQSGGIISGNRVYDVNESYGGGVYNNGTFTMSDGKISGNRVVNDDGGGVYNYYGEFIMTGGEISDNMAENDDGGGVCNYKGTFNLSGGGILNNTAKEDGGGVFNYKGIFNMSDGEISGNKAYWGGGVYNYNGTFNMSDGEISGNEAKWGGGVHNYNYGTFSMFGGKITDNNAEWGGGVDNSGRFTMSNGEITVNRADLGGGLYSSVSGEFNMSGGEINGNNANYGGGVYIFDRFSMSGSANISADNELLLYESNITLTAPITGAGGAYNITPVMKFSDFGYVFNPLGYVLVSGKNSNTPELSNFSLRYDTDCSVVLSGYDLILIGVTDVSLNNGTSVVQTVNITTCTNSFNETVINQTKSGYTFLGWGTADKIVIDTNGNLISNVAEFTNETGFWYCPAYDVALNAVWKSDVPESSDDGGSTDTGSGHYKEYDRSVTDGGHVSFGTSPTVTSVDLPKGVSGSVVLVAESKTPAPEGKETVTVFEINILNYPSGKESEVQFKLTVAEIEKAGYTPADICLYHCDSKGVWTKLPTTFIVKDGIVYYEAVTTEFSPFAIVYEEDGAAEIKQPAVKETETQKALPQPTYTEPTITATPKAEQTKSTIGLIGLIAGLGCYLVALRRK